MRVADLRITAEAFLALLQALDGTRIVTLTGLPEGGRILGVNYDWTYQTFSIRVEADGLEDVPDGVPVPWLGTNFDVAEVGQLRADLAEAAAMIHDLKQEAGV